MIRQRQKGPNPQLGGGALLQQGGFFFVVQKQLACR